MAGRQERRRTSVSIIVTQSTDRTSFEICEDHDDAPNEETDSPESISNSPEEVSAESDWSLTHSALWAERMRKLSQQHATLENQMSVKNHSSSDLGDLHVKKVGQEDGNDDNDDGDDDGDDDDDDDDDNDDDEDEDEDIFDEREEREDANVNAKSGHGNLLLASSRQEKSARRSTAHMFVEQRAGQSKLLRMHPSVVAAINDLWMLEDIQADLDESKMLGKDVYVSLLIKFQYLIVPPPLKASKALQNAEVDWYNDSRRHGGHPSGRMARVMFEDAMFEIADTWSSDADAHEYVQILKQLLLGVSTGDEDGDTQGEGDDDDDDDDDDSGSANENSGEYDSSDFEEEPEFGSVPATQLPEKNQHERQWQKNQHGPDVRAESIVQEKTHPGQQAFSATELSRTKKDDSSLVEGDHVQQDATSSTEADHVQKNNLQSALAVKPDSLQRENVDVEQKTHAKVEGSQCDDQSPPLMEQSEKQTSYETQAKVFESHQETASNVVNTRIRGRTSERSGAREEQSHQREAAPQTHDSELREQDQTQRETAMTKDYSQADHFDKKRHDQNHDAQQHLWSENANAQMSSASSMPHAAARNSDATGPGSDDARNAKEPVSTCTHEMISTTGAECKPDAVLSIKHADGIDVPPTARALVPAFTDTEKAKGKKRKHGRKAKTAKSRVKSKVQHRRLIKSNKKIKYNPIFATMAQRKFEGFKTLLDTRHKTKKSSLLTRAHAHATIGRLYQAKYESDLKSRSKGLQLTRFDKFVLEQHIMQFGSRKMAKRNLKRLFNTVRYHVDQGDAIMRMFAILCGVDIAPSRHDVSLTTYDPHLASDYYLPTLVRILDGDSKVAQVFVQGKTVGKQSANKSSALGCNHGLETQECLLTLSLTFQLTTADVCRHTPPESSALVELIHDLHKIRGRRDGDGVGGSFARSQRTRQGRKVMMRMSGPVLDALGQRGLSTSLDQNLLVDVHEAMLLALPVWVADRKWSTLCHFVLAGKTIARWFKLAKMRVPRHISLLSQTQLRGSRIAYDSFSAVVTIKSSVAIIEGLSGEDIWGYLASRSRRASSESAATARDERQTSSSTPSAALPPGRVFVDSPRTPRAVLAEARKLDAALNAPPSPSRPLD